MDENHYVTVEEFEALVGAARKRKGGGFVRFLCEASILALAIVGGYFLLEIFVGSPAALPPPPANAQGTPLPTPYPTAPRQTGGSYTTTSSGGGGNSLPSCDALAAGDTRTACAPAEVAPAEAQTAPTEAIILAPPAVECYQGSFYTCEELAEMGDEGATEAVKETDAFVDPATLPTAPPAFVEYATNACQAAAVKSPLCP